MKSISNQFFLAVHKNSQIFGIRRAGIRYLSPFGHWSRGLYRHPRTLSIREGTIFIEMPFVRRKTANEHFLCDLRKI